MKNGEDLLSILRRRIELRGRIPFAEFMAAALYEPGLGRYARPDPPMGESGDFVTSPEVDPAFGLLLGRAVAEMHATLGAPDPSRPFTVVEMGPGRGTLCRDLLSGLAREAPLLHREIRYVLVEESDPLRRAQQALLSGEPAAVDRVEWKAWADLLAEGPIRGCLVANEFLDALPVHLVEGTPEGIKEIWIGLDPRGSLVEVAGEPSRPDLEAHFRALGLFLADGHRAEVNLAALRWVREAAGLLSSGYALIVDYGHEAADLLSASHRAGTLLGYRRHRLVLDPLASPGEQDLTSHVDFTSVRRVALEAGFSDWAMTSQRHLLVAMGLPELIASLAGPAGSAVTAEAVRRRFALHALMSPAGMGETFKVLLLGRQAPIAPLRCARNPFRGAVEGAGTGVYYPADDRSEPPDPSAAAASRPAQVSTSIMPRDASTLDTQGFIKCLSGAPSRAEGIRRAVEAIHASHPAWHWAGVYLLEGETLVLAHQVGKPTPHERIPLDRGICGAAAREGATIIVDDVRSDPRYLACSLETRSEIVVPIKGRDGRVLGEIDIDSDLAATFGGEDRKVLEAAAEVLGRFIEGRAGDAPRRGSRPEAPRPGRAAHDGR